MSNNNNTLENYTNQSNLYKPETYKNMSKDEIKAKIQNIGVDISNFKGTYGERNKILEKIVNAMTKGIGIDLPEESKKNYDAFRKLRVLYSIIEPPRVFNDVLDDIIVPFLSEASQNSSFTLVVGPGDYDLNQFYPHDSEFKHAVFDKYPRNAVFVFEGGEGTFAVNYTLMFDESEDSVKSNVWVNKFLDDLARQFEVQKDSIEIEKPNKLTFLFTISKGASKTLFVLYKGDYIPTSVEDTLARVIALTDKNFLVCAIAQGACTDLFFGNSKFFSDYFDFYLFAHGDMSNIKNLKSRSTSFRFNLKKLRNSGIPRNEIFRGMREQRNGQEAMGYGRSKLCNAPRDPSCAEGIVNQGRFWEGLGGKTRRQRKRKSKRTRKH